MKPFIYNVYIVTNMIEAPINKEIIARPIVEKIYVNHVIDNNPDLSWLENKYEDCTPEERQKYISADRRLIEQYNNGLWVSIGIVAHAEVSITYNGLRFYHKLQSSTWGICSFDRESISEYQQEKIDDLKNEAQELGIPISQYLEVIIDEDFKN